MASRFLVATGNWNQTASWSATSGGSPGATAPTSVDDVFLEGAFNITNTATGNCKSITTTGYTGTFTINSGTTVNVFGSMTLVSGMTFTASGSAEVRFQANATLTTAGKSLANLTLDTAGVTLQLADTLTCTFPINIYQGTFTTNDFNVTCLSFNHTNATTTVLNLGSSTITTGSWGCTAGALTVNAGTSTINLTNSFYSPAATYNIVNITQGSSLAANEMVLSGDVTISNLSVAGSQISRFHVQSDTLSTQRTLTVGTLTASNITFMDIAAAGAATWSGSYFGDGKRCSGITFSTPKTCYFVCTASTAAFQDNGKWAATSGGTTNVDYVPLPQDSAVLDNNSFNQATTLTMCNFDTHFPSIDGTTYTEAVLQINYTGTRGNAVTGTMTFFHGDLRFFATGSGSHTSFKHHFVGEGAQRFLPGSDTWGTTGTETCIFSNGGSYTLESNIVRSSTTTTSMFSMRSGTFNLGSNTASFYGWTKRDTASSKTLNLDTGVLYFNASTGTGTMFDLTEANLTIGSTGTIRANLSTSSTKVINLGTKTIGTLSLEGNIIAGFATVTHSGATVTTLSFNSTITRDDDIRFTGGQTLTVGAVLSGHERIKIGSTSGTPATFTSATSGVIVLKEVILTNMTFSGTPTWYARRSTNVSGNSGIQFISSPTAMC